MLKEGMSSAAAQEREGRGEALAGVRATEEFTCLATAVGAEGIREEKNNKAREERGENEQTRMT